MTPIPCLDDVTERPQIPDRPGSVQRVVQILLEPGAVGVRQRHMDQLDPLRQVRADRPVGHAHSTPPRRSDRSSANECDRACSGDPACSPGHRSASQRERPVILQADGHLADGDSAGIRPPHHPALDNGTTPMRAVGSGNAHCYLFRTCCSATTTLTGTEEAAGSGRARAPTTLSLSCGNAHRLSLSIVGCSPESPAHSGLRTHVCITVPSSGPWTASPATTGRRAPG
jgi:hypothetical protein